MNVAKINAVADAIENDTVSGLNFNMNFVMDEAEDGSSSGCIIGYVMALDGRTFETIRSTRAEESIRDAADILGISTSDAKSLSFPPVVRGDGNKYVNGYCATRAQSAEVLRNLANTGNVDWWSTLLKEMV